jgi:tRNA 2-thiouridine synthesizing protein A
MTENQDLLLDVTGLTCPLPVLRAQKRLRDMNPGDILKVLATDPIAAIDFPHFCQESGHELLESAKEEDVWVFQIKCVGKSD